MGLGAKGTLGVGLLYFRYIIYFRFIIIPHYISYSHYIIPNTQYPILMGYWIPGGGVPYPMSLGGTQVGLGGGAQGQQGCQTMGGSEEPFLCPMMGLKA